MDWHLFKVSEISNPAVRLLHFFQVGKESADMPLYFNSMYACRYGSKSCTACVYALQCLFLLSLFSLFLRVEELAEIHLPDLGSDVITR